MGNQGTSGYSEVYIIPGQKDFKNRNNTINASKVSPSLGEGFQNGVGNNKRIGDNMQNRNKQYKYKVSFVELKETFRFFAGKSDHLTKSQFNDSIQKLFNFPDIPFMHHTHLSDKIYHLLDDSGDGKIQEDEFVKGFMNVLCIPDYRNKCNIFNLNPSYSEFPCNDELP